MKISAEKINLCCHEPEIYNRLLSLDHSHILELGCGNARMTRDLATTGVNRRVTALEVDQVAHQKNLQITDLPNVTFVLAGAEQIPLEPESVDVVFMFKSLHHVPLELMEVSMTEIERVLKHGGLAYISEPVFAGDFNEILRLFHDEELVRQAAFDTIRKVVDSGRFKLVEQVFFNAPRSYTDFAEFEDTIIKATYTDHQLDDQLYARVRREFERHGSDNGVHFLKPVRVDLLQRPVG